MLLSATSNGVGVNVRLVGYGLSVSRYQGIYTRTLFREHLINMLSKWRAEGDRLIVCLDANEDIYNKSIGQALRDIDGLAMKEVVGEFTRTPLGTTFFRGSKPIDGIWATSDLTVSNASVMPAGYGIGDHRLFVIDFATQDLVGTHPPKVVRPTSRRLNTKLPGVADRYTKTLEELILKHRLIERTGEVYLQHKSTKTFTRKLNALDSELGDYMRHAEKKCRKIKSGCIPFSPEAALWIRRMQKYTDHYSNSTPAEFEIGAISKEPELDAELIIP
jgi:hypothetical protein